MKIAIIGASPFGAYCSAMLSENHEVILLDYCDKQVEAIQKKGVTVISPNDSEKTYSVNAYQFGDYQQPAELVIVCVPSTKTAQALEENKALFAEDTIVTTIQTGAGNDRKINQYVKPENVIVGISKIICVEQGFGKVKMIANGVVTMGSNYQAQVTVQKVAACFWSSGFTVLFSSDIQRAIWSKLFVDLSVNTFTALIQTPIGYMIQDESAWNFAKRLVYEAVEVAEADGTYFDRREALSMVHKACEEAGNSYSSMYEDRKRKVKMEIDAINGAIVEQAKLYGVPTPYNSLIVDLIHAVEGAYKLYD
ncbi:MAG: ketopantoate reductase family protein [Lachnospiraceae bacterium]